MRPAGELQQQISYMFGDPALLERALTHRSFANEHKLAEHNERMEFLGDAVLSLIITERLMGLWPASPEGELSRFRAAVVSTSTLAAVARDIGLGEFLRLGRGEDQTGGREKESLLADALEALIASLYLDGGLAAAAAFIDRAFRGPLQAVRGPGAGMDFKTALQELCQERMKVLPEYRVASQSGPDHEKQFTIELSITGTVYGSGTGRSKKEAEQRAAKEALEKLRSQDPGARGQEK